MSFKIGFTVEPETENKNEEYKENEAENCGEVNKSLVKVYFEERNAAYSYYNDSFDLERGDFVWVEGKLEGIRGKVIDVSYNFKINLSDYKRVIGVAAADIAGDFRLLGPFFFACGEPSLFNTVKTWYFPPKKENEEIICGNDDYSFDLSDLTGMNISGDEVQKGGEYFEQNKIAYIGISGGHGTAIIDGHTPRVVEFKYTGGQISALTCECFEVGACRHEFAAMLCLREICDFVAENYKDICIQNGFCAIRKSDFFRYVIDTKNTGTVRFEQMS